MQRNEKCLMRSLRGAVIAGFAACLAAFLATPGPAVATGGLWCNADDATLTLAVQSGLGHGIDQGFLRFSADLQIKLDGVPADFRKLHLGKDGISQSWLDNDEFKLRLYRQRERGPSGYVVIDLATKAAAEGDYRGRYTLTVFAMEASTASKPKSWEQSGAVTCSAD